MSFAVKLCTYGRKGLVKLYSKFERTTGNVFSKSLNTSSTNRIYMSASEGAEKTEQLVLKEHGLSEIMSDSVHTPTQIGQTPVHTPILPEIKLPERYVKLEGQVIPYEWDYRAGKYATSYTISPSKPTEYMEIFTTKHYEIDGKMVHERISLGPGKHVQFYDENGDKLGAVVKVQRTSKMSYEETLQYLEDLKKNGFNPNGQTQRPESVVPLEQQETSLEKVIKTLEEPQGTIEKLVRQDNEGNTIVRFLNKDGSPIRKIQLNSDGQIMEYTNFRTLVSDQGIKGGCVLSKKLQFGWNTRPIVGKELPLEDVDQFEEIISRYMRIRESSRYILGTNGEVTRTIQTRKFTPHVNGQVGESFTTTVDARSMGDGKFVEDVIITKGDKRFSRSFWFSQKSGNVHQMDGWCKGLTKEEIELIKSDPFLASRYYNDGLDFARTEKFNAYNTQGLRDKQTPIEFKPPEVSDGFVENGHYQHYTTRQTHRHLNLTPEFIATSKRSKVTNIMHHEPRHGYQHQMTEDLDAGLLEGEEKIRAEIFKDNFANYKTAKRHGFQAYYEQPVEVDARNAGETAEKEFEQNGERIFNIFNKIA